MPVEPPVKRAVAFIDAQNLFHAAKEAFGYRHPNFDPLKLAGRVCEGHKWALAETRLYTGVPAAADNPPWNHFWTAKLAQMGREGVVTYSRALRYRNQTVRLPDGREQTILVGQEKGIDIRVALDVVRLAHQRVYDVALVFREQERWIKIASAFPSSPTSRNLRGINGTDWIRVDRTTYESCIDSRDYRPKARS